MYVYMCDVYVQYMCNAVHICVMSMRNTCATYVYRVAKIYMCNTYICLLNIHTRYICAVYVQRNTYTRDVYVQYMCNICVQSGEDAQDALRYRSLSAKELLIIGLFGGKWPIKIRVAKMRRMPYRYFHFPQQRIIMSGSVAERDLQLKASYASSPPCTLLLQMYVCDDILWRISPLNDMI